MGIGSSQPKMEIGPSLVLMSGDQIIFTSNEGGLRPLVKCIQENMDQSNCILFDKVVGLAAARLIVFSGIIRMVTTPVVSKPAEMLLKEHDIVPEASEIVEKIMNKKNTDICPMEKKAMDMDNESFSNELIKHYKA